MKRVIEFLAVLAAVVCFAACSSNDSDENVSLSDQFMYVGDSVKIGSGINVDNKFVAYVSNDGYLHASHVGETTYGNNGAKANITVKGRHKAFDVITDWGISPTELKSRVHDTPIIDEEADGVYMVAYKQVGCANLLIYEFKDNKMHMVIAMSNPSDEKEILDYLMERYVFAPEEIQAYTWGGADGLDDAHITTIVGLKLNSDFKFDYMLQTYFISKKLGKNNAKVNMMKIQARKIMTSMQIIH